MKVLFFMAHGVFARNFEWTLREFVRRGHRVHVVLDRMEKEGVSRTNTILEACSREYPMLTYGPAPARSRNDFATAGRAFRLVLDYLRYLEPEYAGAEKPRQRLTRLVPAPLRAVMRPLLASGRGRAAVRRVVAFAAGGVPVPREVRRLVADFAPDVMLVTPLVDPGSPQDDYVRCARELGVPSMLAVHSWDNLTLKGGIHTLPDRVAAWNEAQRREAVELHGVPAERVVVTGAVAYDHWFEWQPESDRAAFCRRFGLDPSRPYVLYLGSSEFIAPAEDAFVREWIAAVRDAEPRLRDLQVLVRPHPLDSFDAADLPEGVVVHHSEGAEPLDDAMRRQYYDSIYHSAAVVGVLTSGLIEAAIVDRPVYVLLTERYHETQTGMFHFRHLLPENGGMLHVARNYREHAAQLREALLTQTTEGRNRRFVETFVRPFGLDEAASPRLVDASEALARAPVPAPARPHPGTAARGLARAGWFAMRTLQAFGLVQSTPRVRRADGVERGGRTPSIS